ncbi:hypothetical protein [Clostridium ljungdahlii]|uniref:Uncharacterized protein n=1 Tax=Clostridium ljungdahlii TaxID=1538 RepID=A0A168NGX6_9CLOT|nr:hypothetical protein [Clostridium ljungdahlii]OAA86423.1 hypothetical protein WY13_02412 [Clostridium ljungdahlii]
MISNQLLKELTGNEVKLLIYFDRRIMDKELSIPVRKITEDLNLTVGTVVKSINTLIYKNIIVKRVTGKGKNIRAYYIWNEEEIYKDC